MNCPHCGAPVLSGNVFCHRCRTRISPPGTTPSPEPLPTTPITRPAAPPTPRRTPASRPEAPEPLSYGAPPAAFRRPTVVTILAALDIMGGLMALAGAALVLVAGASGSRGDAPPAVLFFVMAAVYGAIGLVQLLTGIGLLQLKSYGRTLQIVISCIGLLGIPIGTILSILILIYFFKPGVKLLFSGRAPAEMTPEEVALVEKDSQIGVGLVIAFVLVIVLLAVACVGVIAAIAIPSLLRARVSANEAGALGNVRTMVSAQVAYASANSGLYDKPECLVTPSACIPGYPANAPTFLDASFAATGPRSGYVYAFHPKPPAGQRPAASSPSSVTGFAYTATPLQQGRTGVRSFCAEESGAICSSTGVGGRALSAQGGACPADCEPLR